MEVSPRCVPQLSVWLDRQPWYRRALVGAVLGAITMLILGVILPWLFRI